MKTLATIVLVGASLAAAAQDKFENRELIGKVGTRSALLILHTAQRADGS